MATWIFILHMVFPLSSTLPTPADTIVILEDEIDETDEAVRYRGLEQMFARFEAESE